MTVRSGPQLRLPMVAESWVQSLFHLEFQSFTRSLPMIYEKRHERLIGRDAFLLRLFRNFVWTLVIVGISLGGGTFGYAYFGQLSWDDALLNAAMILTGMGPVNPMQTTAGKLFSAVYALYSGLAFLSMVAIILAPVLHRFIHRFHLDDED